MITTADLARRLAQATLADGGATMALDGTVPVTGYAVALPGLETVYTHTDDHDATAVRIRAYVDAHRAELAQSDRYVGTWVDAGKLYVDTVRVIADRATAELEGILARQLAVFDLASGEEITLAPQVTP